MRARRRDLYEAGRPPFVAGMRTAAEVNALLGISPANLWLFDEQGTPGAGTLTVSGAITQNETVTIDATVYRWRNAAGLAQANDVIIGASVAASLVNLTNAINGSEGSGSTYHSGTVAHTTAIATNPTTSTVIATARTYGTAGNSIASTETMANGAWGGATLSGGTAPGNCIDVVAATDLIPTGSPVQGAGTRWPKLAVRCPTDAGNERLLTSATTVFDDDGVTSWAWLFVLRVIPSNPAAVRYLFRKAVSGACYYARWSTGGGLLASFNDGVDTVNVTLTAHVGIGTIPLWIACNRTNTTGYITSSKAASSGSIAAVGSMSNGTGFSIGINGTTPNMDVLWAARFIGAAAENDGVATAAIMGRGLP